jgi:peptidoglycan/LPS O-acetylase OafA/YrhL
MNGALTSGRVKGAAAIPTSGVANRAPRVQVPGVDLLRALAVVAVLYSHISYYLIDDVHSDWWLVSGVDLVLIDGMRLNHHLTFLGVAAFMVLTGLLVTRSAIKDAPGRFMINRMGRLLPSLWLAVLVAIVLVRLGINAVFSGQDGISNTEALLSFVLGGFFLKPEVAVLQVTWTLVVQVLFYLFCIAVRPVLRSVPIAVPIIGALVCEAMLIYNLTVPAGATVPMLSKVAATMPAIFIGQVMYLQWAKLTTWPWTVVAIVAQAEVLELATESHAYGLDEHYVRTMVVVALAVVLLAKNNSAIARSAVVRWLGTRSYAIYLLHTLILYRTYEWTVNYIGQNAAIATFLVVTGLAAEALYRWVELPGSRWISVRFGTRSAGIGHVASNHVLVSGSSRQGRREVDDGGS